MIRALVFALLLGAAPATAADRGFPVTDYQRLRVAGPYEVRVTTAAAPTARVTGDPAAIDTLDLHVEAGTLTIRPRGRLFPPEVGQPRPIVELGAAALRSVTVSGGATLAVTGQLAGERIDLNITGTGALSAAGLRADQLVVTLIGDGDIRLGGVARSVRLTANGGGRIAARALVADDVAVHTEGPVAIEVTARYTALASATGTGPITILGQPDCKRREVVRGTISCFNPKPY